MGRLVLGSLVAVMLALTGYIAYAAYFPPTEAAVSSCSSHKSCCSQEAVTATADAETPACCKDKANSCETKGDEGTCCKDKKSEAGKCCKDKSKAEAIAGADPKEETKKVDEPKRD